MRYLIILLLSCFISPTLAMTSNEQKIQQIIIRTSINNYPSECVCPYSIDYNGSLCNAKSSYYQSKIRPFCYPGDVTVKEIDAFRRKKELWTKSAVDNLYNKTPTPAELLMYE
jgi:hypothetical protein